MHMFKVGKDICESLYKCLQIHTKHIICNNDTWDSNTITSHLSTHPLKYASWLSMHFLAKILGFKIY